MSQVNGDAVQHDAGCEATDWQSPVQHSVPLLHVLFRSDGLQATVLVVVLLLVELLLVELLLVELLLVEEVLVEVVPLTHAVDEFSADGDGHPLLQAAPPGQHVRLTPLPQGVVPAGHPHRLLATLAQATPALQHDVPHGVVPFGQQHEDAGSEHVPPLGQQPWPQTGLPAAQVTAVPRSGLSIIAPAAAAPAAPSTFNAPRREVEAAIRRDR